MGIHRKTSILKQIPLKIGSKIKRLFSYSKIPCNYVELSNMSLDKCWKEFNKYHHIKKSNKNIDWVSVTKTKNYILHDTIIDWFDEKKTPYTGGMGTNTANYYKFNNLLQQKGLKFEDMIINKLSKKYTLVKIINHISELKQEKMEDTLNEMKKGTPIIAQAPLYNTLNMTHGIADLLVRSDYINKIFITKILNKEENRGCDISPNYHYRVIDIKWSAIPLCVNGKHIRNDARYPSYKGQLAIYNSALGNLQGYTPSSTYILGRGWRIVSSTGTIYKSNPFDRLGEIDYETFDKEYIERTANAIIWIRNVRFFKDEWKAEPPSVPELYPNMSVLYDTKYYKEKRQIAENINELTMLWNVGYKHRLLGHKNNIYSWKQDDFDLSKLGITSDKIVNTLNHIIKVNKTNNYILPEIIMNNDMDWKVPYDLDMFIDYETTNTCIANNDMLGYNNLIFLIGLWHYRNDKWQYKYFLMENTNEVKVIDDFKNYVEEVIREYMIKHSLSRDKCYPKFIHWGETEQSLLDEVNKKYRNRYYKWINSVYFLDLCNVFKEEPIVIKGSFNFGLKEIVRAMCNNKMISSNWSECNITDGGNVSLLASQYYFSQSKNKLTDKQTNQMNDIIKYNEVDCRVLYDIIEYLRSCIKKESKSLKRRKVIEDG